MSSIAFLGTYRGIVALNSRNGIDGCRSRSGRFCRSDGFSVHHRVSSSLHRHGSGGIGIGKHRHKELIASELSVRITDRATGSTIWEGRAQLDGAVGEKEASPAATASRLAAALFKGFPGESGRTIKVS